VIGRKSAEERYTEGKAAVSHFWGRTSANDDDMKALESTLGALKLKPAALDRIKMELPAITPGTTGDKIRRANSLLTRLVAATGG
jgi:hypothetical protein